MNEQVTEPAELASFVRTRRAELGMTQEEAAQRANIGVSTWRQIEKGEHTSFRGLTLARTAHALDVPTDVLISASGQSVSAHPGAREWPGSRRASGVPIHHSGAAIAHRHGVQQGNVPVPTDVVWRVAPKIAQLSEGDAELVEALVDRLLGAVPSDAGGPDV